MSKPQESGRRFFALLTSFSTRLLYCGFAAMRGCSKGSHWEAIGSWSITPASFSATARPRKGWRVTSGGWREKTKEQRVTAGPLPGVEPSPPAKGWRVTSGGWREKTKEHRLIARRDETAKRRGLTATGGPVVSIIHFAK